MPVRAKNWLSSLACRFARQDSGSVLITFAFGAIVLLAVAGAAIDYARASQTRVALQAATDSAALAAAKLDSKDVAKLRSAASQYFTVNTAGIDASQVVLDGFTYNEATGAVSVNAKASVSTSVMSVLGFNSLDVTANSTAVKEVTGTVELALVLDNTWSMSESAGGSDSKITVLKGAAKKLVETVLKDSSSNNVKVSLVPFADYVNVGVNNRGQPWVSVPPDSTTTSPKTCETKTTKQECTRGTPKTCTRSTDGVTETYDCTPSTCVDKIVPAYEVCSGGGTTKMTWYGCVGSRVVSNLWLSDAQPTEPYPGFLDRSQNCLSPIVPLTNDKSKLTTAINGLIINIGGYRPSTYIPAGVVWGVNVLSATAPFMEGAAYDSANRRPRKVMVLMTDGNNTMRLSKSDGKHLGTNSSSDLDKTDADTSALCAYAKGRSIELYTIAFAVSDLATKTMLEGCASGSDHYFDATNSAALNSAFETIGASLNSLRLSR
ncbi:pilus assembly protein TadG-related protein [Bosea sp. BK604]|uniref:pilus assembly protein TadG-related protein n=1 Tax=Bosea sp. BK604 TaxID=2512180 RepID=UPI00104AE041|nr:pilus assembly protein TadG-related protein [Bosea sp. BK604]TCR62632.1 Flp pilus assembly protein TadG [Bosea sp. BK604]